MKGEKNINRGRAIGLSSNPTATLPIPGNTGTTTSNNTSESHTNNIQNTENNKDGSNTTTSKQNQANNENNVLPPVQESKITSIVENNKSSQTKANGIVGNKDTGSDSDTGNDGKISRNSKKSGNKSRLRKTNMRLASSSALLTRQNRRLFNILLLHSYSIQLQVN